MHAFNSTMKYSSPIPQCLAVLGIYVEDNSLQTLHFAGHFVQQLYGSGILT